MGISKNQSSISDFFLSIFKQIVNQMARKVQLMIKAEQKRHKISMT